MPPRCRPLPAGLEQRAGQTPQFRHRQRSARRTALCRCAADKGATGGAVAVSSLLFGLWHVLPALQSIADNLSDETPDQKLGTLAHVAGTVAATRVAGVGFAILRLRSKSILAPVIVHAAVNSSAFIATRRITR